MEYPVPNGPDIAGYISGFGTKVEPRKLTSGGTGVTLASGTTYYFPLSNSEGVLGAVHLRGITAGLIITAARIEDTCMPGRTDALGNTDVPIWDTTTGNWLIENPSTAYVPVVGTGWTVTAATVAAAGTGAGGALWNLGNMGTRRSRLAIVVGGTGGDVRVCGHLKGA